jgi:hypothetical protein
MKKNLLFILVSSFALSLTSQISITQINMPVSGDTCRYSNAKLSSVGDYTTTGTNYPWIFDTLRPTSQAIREFKAVANTPYTYLAFLLGAAAYGEKTIDTVKIPSIPGLPSISITDIYNFYNKSSALFKTEGVGVKLNGIPVPNLNSDDDELYFFPLNYTDRDSSTFRFSTLTTTLVPFQYIKQGYRITKADGWGSITTPYGTANCLRIVTTQYSIDTIKVFNVPIFGTVAFGFPNYQRSYQWLTLGEKIPYLEVSGNVVAGNFTPTQAKYRDSNRSFVGIKEENTALAISVFPNPSSNQLTIITPKNTGSIVAEIVDLQGKLVLHKDLINNSEIVNQHQLDVSNLSKGVYVLNLSNISGKQTLKISVQ